MIFYFYYILINGVGCEDVINEVDEVFENLYCKFLVGEIELFEFICEYC